MSQTRSWSPTLKQRLGLMVVELALLGVAYFILKLDELLAGAIAAVIIAATVLPGRWGVLASGVGLIGLAGLAHFHYGHRPLAIVLLVLGLVSIAGSWRTIAGRSGGS